MQTGLERTPLAVFAVGNQSRGDDGLAHILLRRIEPYLPAGARASSDFQLQIEHALDLRGAELALFVDAAIGLELPFVFYEVLPVTRRSARSSVFSHALSPAAVLEVYLRIEGNPPPPAFVLAIRAGRFALGEGLSAAARADCEAALRFAQALVSAPQAVGWRALATGPGAARVTAAVDRGKTATRRPRG